MRGEKDLQEVHLKTLIVISECLSRSKEREGKHCSHFHFKGVYRGEEVRVIECWSDQALEVGEQYILHLEYCAMPDGKLKGRLLKAKLIKGLEIEF
jgi:hypothetical protein